MKATEEVAILMSNGLWNWEVDWTCSWPCKMGDWPLVVVAS